MKPFSLKLVGPKNFKKTIKMNKNFLRFIANSTFIAFN